ncbi:type III secretion system cytoplasmic ring protein SctQ [Chelatococcus sp. GCM10030263]|uniref:type III secretion system cytoplasmic ring protein SctQ n=1 Tax=Chelatococcus sp. GCM10030263 TaxID=3273387 RepID=UPI00361F653B
MMAMPTIAPLRDAQLPSIPLEHLACLKGFFKRRAPLAFSVGEMAVTMEAAAPDEAPQDPIAVAVTIDGEMHVLVLAKALVDAVLAALDPALDGEALKPQVLALLLESAAAPAIAALESRADVCIRFETAAAAAPSATTDRLNLPFRVKASSGPSIALLNLTLAGAERLVRLLDEAAPKPPRFRDLPLPVSLRQMAVQLPLADVKSVAVGDVIVSEGRAAQPDRGVILVAGMLVAPVELKPEGSVLLEPLKPARGSPLQWCMDMPSASSPDTSFDEMPVQIVIELGRLDLPLAEIEALAPGSLLPLGRNLEEGVDILANGRRIGRGTLVTIGDSLGVRVARLGQG